MLNRKKSEPLYIQLKNVIEHKINTNEYKVNEQIPSERELGEMFNVSRITVRQAISLAEKEGIVSKVHGVGTFVTKPKVHQKLNSIADFKSTVAQLGLIASTKLIKSDVIMSDFKITKLLNLNIMDKVLNLQLLGLGDSKPIVYYDAYFPYSLGKEIKEGVKDMYEAGTPFSTLNLYDSKYTNYKPTHIEQTFEAIIADETLAKTLDVPEGFPLLKVFSIVYQNDQPLEYKESFYRGDKYRFFVTRNMK